MEVKIKYPKTKCKWCGKTFTKTHNRQVYCSTECRKNAKREQDRNHWIRWYHRNKNKTVTQSSRCLGTSRIGAKKHEDNNKEQKVVENEIRRIGLTPSISNFFD